MTRFASLTPQVAAALPPFDIPYDLKLHWHRRFDNEPRSIWLREQLAAVFKDHQWLEPPPGPPPFLESSLGIASGLTQEAITHRPGRARDLHRRRCSRRGAIGRAP